MNDHQTTHATVCCDRRLAVDDLIERLRAWQRYEAGERRMHPALWELFLLKTVNLAAASQPYVRGE